MEEMTFALQIDMESRLGNDFGSVSAEIVHLASVIVST